MASIPFLLAASVAATITLRDVVPDATPVHVGISLNVTHTGDLASLRRAQQDPTSPQFRRWITPAEYGERFGQPAAVYARVSAWLHGQGFEVREFPNRTFIEGSGSAAKVSRLLGVHLHHVANQPAGVHVPDVTPRLPTDLTSVVLSIAGLDTHVRQHHRLSESGGAPPALGPQDVRRFYGLEPLLEAGYVGQRQRLVVLAEAEPPASVTSPEAIRYYLQNVSDSRAEVIFDTLANPQQDVDPGGGGNEEFEPDVELQSIGAPGAESITLVISPASEVFATGANEIATNLSSATSVSISLGSCEQQNPPSDVTTLENLVVQGTVEGQTWSAATGDTGSDDCGDGMTVSVDFPASLPEIVAMGGSEIQSPVFDANDAITAYQTEVVWSEPMYDSAAGGGLSVLFPTPTYQEGLGLSARSVPDLVLLAGNPGVAADSTNPFIGLPIAAQLTSFEGTSASSPLSAGFFALIASRLGCRLGDPHAALYAMGRAEVDGGAPAFHDITMGTVALDGVPGPSAMVGYDSASGWGSFDVAAMAAAWPPCPAAGAGDAGYDFDGGIASEAPYAQCDFIACDAGTPCTTLPEGPSGCAPPCGGPHDAGCSRDNVCVSDTLFADAGICVPGCTSNVDCTGDAGEVCNLCEQTCIVQGSPDASVGIPCTGPLDCLTGSLCLTVDMSGNTYPDGYCTTFCDPTGTFSACGCPEGTICSPTMAVCLASCPAPGHGCRSGYACQPNGNGTASCQLPCQILTFNGQTFDTCSESATPKLKCDTKSGVCGGVVPLDAGVDGGKDGGDASLDADLEDGGDGGPAGDAGNSVDKSTGCGCTEGGSPADGLFGVVFLAGFLRFRRGRRRSCVEPT